MTRSAWAPSTNRAGPGPRTALAVLAGKGTGLASRLLGRGGGTALPGLVAERLDPRIVERLASQVEAPRVVVTGTNGKTTTARLLGAILRAAGHRPIRNGAGSNLMRGIAATLLHEAGTSGRLPPDRPAVFEVDEATLVQAGRALRPNVLVFTNLFRDQLDRYGEIDSVAEVWREALQALPGDARIVLNADDPLVARLSSVPEGRSVLYGIEDRSVALGEAEHASDSRWCPRCDRDYTYEALFFGHIGWWRCPQCGDHRPTPDVGAADVRLVDDERASFSLRVGPSVAEVQLALGGLYNVENALAAAAAAVALGIPIETIAAGLRDARAAFGRQERLRVGEREVRLLLAKNPAGANQALRTISLLPGAKDIVFVLNDDIADGTDISWIWDVDYQILQGQEGVVVASGQRAEDMALRLKYAGLSGLVVEPAVSAALRRALAAGPAERPLFVLPTYTAMLQAREVLGDWAAAGHFWEAGD